jgi:hypothetical protein
MPKTDWMSPDDYVPGWEDVSRRVEVEMEDGTIVIGLLTGDTYGSDTMHPEIDTIDYATKGWTYTPAVPFGWPRRYRFLD